MSDTIETMPSESTRFLHSQIDDNGRIFVIRIVLYLVVLALCFVLPMYARCLCDDRQYRARARDQDMEDAPPIQDGPGATTVLASVEEQSETRAMRKKIRAERRARIVQLFSPVSVVS
jgi:hypothetical protein